MKRDIKDIEEITGCEDGTVILFLKGEKEGIECNRIEFDHEAGKILFYAIR